MTDKPLLGRADAVPRRRWRWLLPLVLGLAVVALITSVIIRQRNDDAASPESALNTYLDALESNATVKAYGLLCAKRPPQREFQKQVASEREHSGGVLGHKISDVTKRDKGVVVARYTVRYRDANRFWAAALVKEAEGWRVCGFRSIPVEEVRLPAEGIPVPPGFDDTGNTATTR